jgi:hypothetical protein
VRLSLTDSKQEQGKSKAYLIDYRYTYYIIYLVICQAFLQYFLIYFIFFIWLVSGIDL